MEFPNIHIIYILYIIYINELGRCLLGGRERSSKLELCVESMKICSKLVWEDDRSKGGYTEEEKARKEKRKEHMDMSSLALYQRTARE